MRRILVTGGNGLLGSQVHTNLGGFKITSGDCDLRENSLHDYVMSNFADDIPHTIIHCAAKVGWLGANMSNNELFFKYNTCIDNNVLKSAFDLGVDNLVTILSTCVFPDNIEYPLTIDKLDDGPPHDSNYGYSYAKRLLAYQTRTYRNVTKKNWISIVPTNLYGPNDNFHLEDSHLVPALIRKGYECTLDGTDFAVWGDGTPLRQFVYSKDMAKIIEWAIDEWDSDTPLMAINEQEYSIKDVVNIIADRFDISEKRVKYDTSRPSGQHRKPAKTDVDWFKFTPLEEGINETIDWFIKNYDKGTVRL